MSVRLPDIHGPRSNVSQRNRPSGSRDGPEQPKQSPVTPKKGSSFGNDLVQLNWETKDSVYLEVQGQVVQKHLNNLLHAMLDIQPRNPAQLLSDCITAMKYSEAQHSADLETAIREWLHLQDTLDAEDSFAALSIDSSIAARAGDGLLSNQLHRGKRVFLSSDYRPDDLEVCIPLIAEGKFEITGPNWVLCPHCSPPRPYWKPNYGKHLLEEHPSVVSTDASAKDKAKQLTPLDMLSCSRQFAELVLRKFDGLLRAGVATKGHFRPSVSDVQCINLYSMQSDLYSACNKVMRDGLDSGIEQFRPFIAHVHQALLPLPVYEGSTFRGIDCAVPPDLYVVDSVVTWQAFTSSSKNPSIAALFLSGNADAPGTLFVLWSKKGRLIKQFSMHTEEDEVLHDYNSQWRVVSKMDKDKALLSAAMKRNIDLVEVYVLHEVVLATWGDVEAALTHSERVLNKALLKFIKALPVTWRVLDGTLGNFPPLIDTLPMQEFHGKMTSPLHLIARTPQPVAVTRLITANLPLTQIDETDGDGKTALLTAIEHENIPCALYLLVKGASLEHIEKREHHVYLLHWACEEGDELAVAILLTKSFVEDLCNIFLPELESRALTAAATAGHLEVVKMLCTHGADLEARHPLDGTTPLWKAAYHGRQVVVKFLASQGASVTSESNMGESVLYGACMNGQQTVVQYLVEERRLSPGGGLAKTQNTPVMAAAHAGHWALVQYLCDHGGSVNARNSLGWSALFMASQMGHTPVVKHLVTHGAEVDCVNLQGTSPLGIASLNGFVDTIDFLLDSKADVNRGNVLGTTALHMAAREGQGPATDLLVARGADVNARDAQGLTPLMGAAQCGHLPVLRALIGAGAAVTEQTRDGVTAFHMACVQGMSGAAELLLRHGARHNWHAPPPSSAPPLGMAAWTGQVRLVRVLLRAGADVNATDGHGWTPLMVALAGNNAACARALLEADARFDLTDGDGWTALYIGALAGCTEGVRCLAEQAADLQVVTVIGETPMHAAAVGGHKDVVELLEGYGVDIFAANRNGITPWMAATLGGRKELATWFRAKGVRVNQSYCDRPASILAAADKLRAVALHYQLLYDRFSGMFWGKDTAQE